MALEIRRDSFMMHLMCRAGLPFISYETEAKTETLNMLICGTFDEYMDAPFSPAHYRFLPRQHADHLNLNRRSPRVRRTVSLRHLD